MAIPERIKAKSHLFMPGHTVMAAIKECNLYQATKEEMVLLLEQYKMINPEAIIRPGMRVMVPILQRLQDEVFNT